MAPAGAGAGPVMKQAETEYALSELANVAIANARCDLQTPDAYFDQLLALNRQGWTAKRALILRSLEHTRQGKRHMTRCRNRNGWPNVRRSQNPRVLLSTM